MSGMRLRSTIRAPARFGEADTDEQVTAPASYSRRCAHDPLNSGDDELEQLRAGSRRRKSPVRPRTKPYDPNRPPVAWKTKDYPGQAEDEGWAETEPRNTQTAGYQKQDPKPASFEEPKSPDKQLNQELESSLFPSLPGRNVPAYAALFEAALNVDDYDANQDTAYMTSDSEHARDERQIQDGRAGRITNTCPRPRISFGDLKPSLQIEIADNYTNQLETEIGDTFEDPVEGCWYTALTKLEVSDDEYQKLFEYTTRRFRAMDSEDKTLLAHRKMQRAVLGQPAEGVPRDVVQKSLGQVMKKLRLKLKRLGGLENYDEVRMANTAEVRQAYEFLDRLRLPRSLVGEWNNGMQTVIGGEDEHPMSESEMLPMLRQSTVSESCAESAKRPDLRRDDAVHSHSYLAQNIGDGSAASPAALQVDEPDHGPSEDIEEDTPCWHKQHMYPLNVTDSQARFQWALEQAQLEKTVIEAKIEKAQLEKAALEAEIEHAQDPWEASHTEELVNPYDESDVWADHMNDIPVTFIDDSDDTMSMDE